MSNSITEIGESTFADCTALRDFKISKSVTEIGSGAFYGCTSLKHIEIPNSVINLGDKQKFVHYVPEDVEKCDEIFTGVFEGCTGLTSVEIPNSVTKIVHHAFEGCTGLTSVEIPNSVTEIGERAFAGCTGLERIECDDKNEYYKSIDGVLFDKNVSVLLQIPDGKQADIYKIPSNVIQLRESSICCEKINKLFVPSSVSNIDEDAIYAENIKEIFIYHEHPEEIIMEKGRPIKQTDCVLYVPIGTENSYRNHWFFGEHFKEVIPIKMKPYNEEPD